MFALGILPYITASIIMQLLTVVIPKLAHSRKKASRVARSSRSGPAISTVVLALIQSTGFTFLFHTGRFTNGIDLIPNYTAGPGDR